MQNPSLHVESLATLARQNPKKLARLIADLTDAQADELLHDWELWARRDQREPWGDWKVWVILAGRGAGKTRTGSEWIRLRVKTGSRRIALLAPTAADVRDIMIEGESGILGSAWSGDRDWKGEHVGVPKYEPSKRRLTWRNGAIATAYSGEEPDRLRGPQHDSGWADELAAFFDAQGAWDMFSFGLRLGNNPRALVTTTPRPLPIIKKLRDDDDSAYTTASTYANAANLAPDFIQRIKDKYEGTRLGRQEIAAEILDDIPGALWTRAMIDRAKFGADQKRLTFGSNERGIARNIPDMARMVVAVDPSGTKGLDEKELAKREKADDIGIIVAGLGVDGKGYIFEDATCNLSPLAWGRRVCERYAWWKADRVVGEINFGGALVESTIRAANPFVSFKQVTASRGKVARAEPVAALFEQDRVKLVGDFAQLEDQLCYFDPSGYLGEGSPDRADAMVWAITELMLGDETFDRSLSWV